MRLRESLISMLGEFVGLNKSPDFKLTPQSAQYIAEAVAAETKRHLLELQLASERKTNIGRRGRIHSSDSARPSASRVSMDPSLRRSSEPSLRTDYRFLPKFCRSTKPSVQVTGMDDRKQR